MASCDDMGKIDVTFSSVVGYVYIC